MWPVAKSGSEGEADTTTGLLVAEKSAEPGPERPATQWQERETEAKQSRAGARAARPGGARAENTAQPRRMGC